MLTVIISLYFNETKKKLNCLIYIALAKHCWVIKKSDLKKENLKVIKNTLPDKSGNPGSLKK